MIDFFLERFFLVQLLFSGLLEFGFEGCQELGECRCASEIFEPVVFEEVVYGRERAGPERLVDELDGFLVPSEDGIEAGEGVVGSFVAENPSSSDFDFSVHVELVHKIDI